MRGGGGPIPARARRAALGADQARGKVRAPVQDRLAAHQLTFSRAVDQARVPPENGVTGRVIRGPKVRQARESRGIVRVRGGRAVGQTGRGQGFAPETARAFRRVRQQGFRLLREASETRRAFRAGRQGGREGQQTPGVRFGVRLRQMRRAIETQRGARSGVGADGGRPRENVQRE